MNQVKYQLTGHSRSSGSIRVIVLYSTVVHYVLGVLRAVCKQVGTEIDVVYWDRKGVNSSLYEIERLDGVKFHPRSSFDDDGVLKLLQEKKPDIVWVCGWQDAGYVNALRRYRASGYNTRVVCGIDDQWKGSLRQRLGQLYFRLFYRSIFDYMWVAGKPQYQYAQRFGYGPEKIVSHLLSADSARFFRRAPACRRFVFVGRFDPVKGLDLLLDAYTSLPAETKEIWPLVLIGDGELRSSLESRNLEHVQILPFLQPSELIDELERGGVGCITSTHEQWGVAIHEMAMLGYPLVLSSACGAATEFLISGYNGYLFNSGDIASLRNKLLAITMLSDADLESFSVRSNKLGNRITPELSAAALLSVVELD